LDQSETETSIAVEVMTTAQLSSRSAFGLVNLLKHLFHSLRFEIAETPNHGLDCRASRGNTRSSNAYKAKGAPNCQFLWASEKICAEDYLWKWRGT